MFVDHANAAVGNRAPDGLGLCGPVDAEIGVFAVLEQVKGTRAERVFGAAGLNVVIVLEATIGFRIAFDHFLGWAPCGPFFFDINRGLAGEFEARLADANAVAHCLAGASDEIEEMASGEDQDLTGGKARLDGHLLRGKDRIKLKALLGREGFGKRGGCGGRCEEMATIEHGAPIDWLKITPVCPGEAPGSRGLWG